MQWVKDGGYEYDGPGGTNYRGKLSGNQFDTIIVQLKAIGVIERSRRTRSVKDTNTYWKLTPFGDAQVTSLIAIQSGETRNDTSALEEDGADSISST